MLAPVTLALLLEGRFYGAEFGQTLHAHGEGVLLGYAINALLAFGLGIVCCQPALVGSAGEPPLAPAFRRALVLLFTAKLAYFLL